MWGEKIPKIGKPQAMTSQSESQKKQVTSISKERRFTATDPTDRRNYGDASPVWGRA